MTFYDSKLLNEEYTLRPKQHKVSKITAKNQKEVVKEKGQTAKATKGGQKAQKQARKSSEDTQVAGYDRFEILWYG